MASNFQKVEVSKRLELIFSQAAALSQAGRFRSEIYVMPGEVFMANGDGTVVMRFEAPFAKNSFAFKTDDYDSSTVKVGADGSVSFVTQANGWTREKTPQTISLEKGKEIKKAWKSLTKQKVSEISFTFHRDRLSLLEERMSHLEISSYDGRILLLQRDIYSGTIVRVWEDGSSDGLGIKKRPDFGPVALRTGDFLALFAFQSQITLNLFEDWAYAQGGAQPPYEAVLGTCIFDEMVKEE